MNNNQEKDFDFTGLKAIFLNCTLKPSPQKSHTETLMKISKSIMEKNNIETEMLRPVDFDVAPGLKPDMTEHGFDKDDWPQIQEKVLKADILVLGTPIWLGDKSSICKKVIERLYGNSSNENEKGQYLYYGRTAGCMVCGNEDGYKNISMDVLYSLQHIGYMIPPQADTGWVGEAGPGKSFGDETENGYMGFDNDFTKRGATFMTWNLMHTALILKKMDGFPAYGNQPSKWEEGERYDLPALETLL